MTGSERLRELFYDDAAAIQDGWTILAEVDMGDYGHDLLMYLRGPDGSLYCQEAHCCSCYGIEDQWSPVETNTTTIELDAKGYENFGRNGLEKARCAREALARIEAGE